MSVTRTFTVTVVSTGSGNKYFINGVQQDTVYLAEGYTYRFDQSDYSNSGHPLRFSTTSNGTHSGGSEYTTGVTTNGTPGFDDAYTQITVASSAPTLYYYCTQHSGMGGTANTPTSNTWSMLTWSQNSWGAQDTVTVSPTGVSATSSVGDGTNMGVPQQGWGGQSWSTGEWGEVNDNTVELTGLSITSSIGTVIAAAAQGWGRAEWGEEPWGESDNPVVKPTGISATLSLGTVSVSAQIAAGWGQDGWGDENWGQSGLTLEITAPDAMQSSVSANAWNDASWGQGQGWGEFILSPADVVGLTGQQITSAVPSQLDIPEQVQGFGITSSVGSITPGEFVVGVGGQAVTSSVGSLSPADVVGLTGQAITASEGSESLVIGAVELILPSGVSATVSVGSIDPIPMVVGLGGQAVTSSVGSLTPADVMGLTGVSGTVSVAGFGTASGFGIQAYSDVDTGSNSSYTDVATGSNTSYTDAA